MIIRKKNLYNEIYNEKILKTKIMSNVFEATDFHSRRIREAGFYYICWLIELIDSVLKKDKNCYSQTFLKYCKYIKK